LKAVITAGGPIDGDYARAAGMPLKALAPVRGQTMLAHTILALRQIGVRRIAVVGNDAIRDACASSVERIIPDGGSGSRNVLGALDAWEEDGEPLLYLTCDMPYVNAAALRDFVERTPSGALAMPLCEYAAFAARFPGSIGFGVTLGGERVVNGGVFHIPAGASHRIRSFATQLFKARKAPWRMATIAGPLLLVRMLVGRLTIARLEARGRTLLDMPVQAVRNALPELGFDADTIEDYRYACGHD
jgi:GTP:adenosylcobinamide-phosphate guanylyltransferase